MTNNAHNIFYCPICESHSKEFNSFGIEFKRKNAQCPKCGSLERQRMLWLFLKSFFLENQLKKTDILHIAPERCMMDKIKNIAGVNYISGDLNMSRATLILDLTDIKIRDNQLDLIICSHVLEHIPDDQAAMNEMFRILKRNGTAAIMVPLHDNETYEDFSIVSPEERTIHFGQFDHVRRYGIDIIKRLESAGFIVKCYPSTDELEDSTISIISAKKQIVFLCKKP